MNHINTVFSLLLVAILVNSCSDFISAEKYGDDIYADVSINPNQVQAIVGDVIAFDEVTDVIPSKTDITKKWVVEPASVAQIDEYGTATVTNLGKAVVIIGLYDKKQNLVASDSATLYALADKKLGVDGSILSFTQNNDEEGIFVGTSGSENLYSSLDDGDNWISAQIPVSNSAITNIARSVAEPDHIIATYREMGECCDAQNYTGVLASKDNGQSWQEVAHPYEPINGLGHHFYNFSDIVFAPDDSETVYILSEVYIDNFDMILYRSTDLGLTWDILHTFSRGSSTLPSLFIDNDDHTIVVSTAGAVNGEQGFVSTDYGNTFTSWPTGVTEELFHMDDAGGLYAGTFEGNTTYSAEQVVYSDDKAQSWKIIYEHDSYGLNDLDTYDLTNIALLIDTGSSHSFSLNISKNKGASWKEFQPDLRSLLYTIPLNVKILNANEERMEVLVTFRGSSSGGGQEQLWKFMIYFDML